MPADATLLVFAGTWCSDTQNLLPKFYKSLDDAGIARERVKLYLLDEQKNSPEQLEKQYQVVSVPTFIVLQNGKELGRIVESVQQSIEADLAKQLQKKGIVYSHILKYKSPGKRVIKRFTTLARKVSEINGSSSYDGFF